jgi:hypothetical protein
MDRAKLGEELWFRKKFLWLLQFLINNNRNTRLWENGLQIAKYLRRSTEKCAWRLSGPLPAAPKRLWRSVGNGPETFLATLYSFGKCSNKSEDTQGSFPFVSSDVFIGYKETSVRAGNKETYLVYFPVCLRMYGTFSVHFLEALLFDWSIIEGATENLKLSKVLLLIILFQPYYSKPDSN